MFYQLSRMDRRGLVARKEYANNRRTTLVAATQAGRSAMSKRHRARPRKSDDFSSTAFLLTK
ncbi:hypothetical protein [Streptomyces sp. NPDC101149]|uniref:hypothetical protein n=1 Tax=Streptomyces sp. NPDC101149 TaxID=3366113 RepID=UPI003802690F